MTHLQKLAHARLLARLPVHTHLRMNTPQEPWNKGISSVVASEKGKKGREAAGLVIPEFRTRKQHMTDKRKRFNRAIK